MPAQKPPPAPVSTPTLSPSSESSSSSALAMPSASPRFTALRASGRLRVMIWMRPSRVTRTGSACCSVSVLMARHDASVREWPPITEPELLERRAFDAEQFRALVRELAASFGPREPTPALLERALGYPWERPARSYLMRSREVQLLEDLDAAEREEVIREFARDRHPLLAFGSN